VLKHRCTYEIINPSSVGLSESMMVLGKHSGKHALKMRLKKLGYHVHDAELIRIFDAFKILADRKKVIYDEDLEALVDQNISKTEEMFKLLYLNVTSSTPPGIPTATVKMESQGKIFQEAATGDGPVDALYKAIERLSGVKLTLLDYSLKALTGGKDAMGEVYVKAEGPGRFHVTGRSSSTDILEASAKAYVVALNKYLNRKKNKKTATGL
ncbi:MAG: 2-isopropylmalate synthase, partial [Candidatus Aureabacteria bacterium]|nr:2-isopropylmalate synthase [Candidatus Auribacterota bacterium]